MRQVRFVFVATLAATALSACASKGFVRKNIETQRVSMAGQLNGERQRPIQRQRTPDRGTFQILHDQVVGTDVVERIDMGVIQRRDGPRFAPKALAELRGGDLDGDDAAEPGVARLPHLPHAAGAEGREDLVGAEAGAGGKGHSESGGLYGSGRLVRQRR